MAVSNKLLHRTLCASVLLHLAVLAVAFTRPVTVVSPGTGTLTARLTTAAAAQPPRARPEIESLPDISATPPVAGAVSREVRPSLPGGEGGSEVRPRGRNNFNDMHTEIGQYPRLPLPSNDLTIPYLPPRLYWQISPHYPDAAFARKLKGYVRLELLIDRLGEVVSARVAEAQPQGVFDEAAWRAFHGARFEPAYEYGQPVASKVSVRVVFDPDDKRAPRPEPTALE